MSDDSTRLNRVAPLRAKTTEPLTNKEKPLGGSSMFVHPSRLLAQGTITLLGFAIGACDAPVANTDLRPDGDPEVLTVLMFNNACDGVLEGATFCKTNDNKRP